MQNFCGDGPKFLNIGGFSQAFAKLFAAFKPPQQEVPVLFQAEHGVPGTAEFLGLGVQKLIIEAFQSIHRGSAGSQHARVTDQTPAQHHGSNGGKFFGKILNLR